MVDVETKNKKDNPFLSNTKKQNIQSYKNYVHDQNTENSIDLNPGVNKIPISTSNPYLEGKKENQEGYETGSKGVEVIYLSSAMPPSSPPTEDSTPSTQRSIPPPTVQSAKPKYIITTTTETPSPTRRVHSIRRLEFPLLVNLYIIIKEKNSSTLISLDFLSSVCY